MLQPKREQSLLSPLKLMTKELFGCEQDIFLRLRQNLTQPFVMFLLSEGKIRKRKLKVNGRQAAAVFQNAEKLSGSIYASCLQEEVLRTA